MRTRRNLRARFSSGPPGYNPGDGREAASGRDRLYVDTRTPARRAGGRAGGEATTTELGGALFGRYYVWGPVFVHAEAERTNWEYVTQIGDGYTTVKSDYTAFYGGAGFQVPTGGRAAMYMSFLYDFNFDDNVPHPSSDPFVIRIGYGVFF